MDLYCLFSRFNHLKKRNHRSRIVFRNSLTLQNINKLKKKQTTYSSLLMCDVIVVSPFTQNKKLALPEVCSVFKINKHLSIDQCSKGIFGYFDLQGERFPICKRKIRQPFFFFPPVSTNERVSYANALCRSRIQMKQNVSPVLFIGNIEGESVLWFNKKVIRTLTQTNKLFNLFRIWR